MPKYSESVIEEIKNRLRLSDVIGSYVRLTRVGSTDDFKACCPFHKEKTPSFLVHDDKGFFKCFGCGKSGNMFTFLMEMEHLTFPESIQNLAKKAGIELKEETEKEKKQYSRQQAIQDIYNRISKSFHQVLLLKKEASEARNYIEKRNISSESCEKFLLGYAPSNSDWLYDFLKKQNYSDELLWESGLIYKEHNGLANQPFFKNRILFPVRTWQGNVVAFSGRDLNPDSKVKYKNSSDSVIYSKKNNLFGFYESLPLLKEKQQVILCEGNFDVVSLHQAGIGYACAPLGTSFTIEQAQLIKRYCKKVFLLFDSDNAGQKATIRAALICQQNDLETYVIKPFDNAKDASQMLEEQGAEALAKACENVEPAFSHLVHSALKLYDIRQPKGKLSVFKEVSPYLEATSSDIERQGYVKYLSEILRISEEQILSDFRKHKQSGRKSETDSEFRKEKTYSPAEVSVQLNVLLHLIKNRNGFEYFRHRVRINYLQDDFARKLFTVLEDAVREGIESDEVIIQMIDNQELKNLVISFLAEDRSDPGDTEELDSVIDTINIARLEERRNNILQLINGSEVETTGQDEILQMIEAKVKIDREIEELKAKQRLSKADE